MSKIKVIKKNTISESNQSFNTTKVSKTETEIQTADDG
jgi:hypothetical protein